MSQIYSGFIYDDAGAAVASATVNLYDRNTTSPSRANTTTNASGFWTITHSTEGRFDVKANKDSWVRWYKYDDALTVEELETGVLRIRGTDDAFALIIQHTASAQRTVVYADQNLWHPVTKIKASDETVNSGGTGSTLQDDDDLLWAVGINEEWAFDFYLKITSGLTPDIKFQFSAPTNATVDAVVVSGTAQGSASEAAPAVIGTIDADEMVHIHGVALTGNTAGNVVLQWAQNVSDAGDTKVLTGSCLIPRRIS